MIPVIIATVSFITVIAVTSLIIVKGADMKKQYDNQLRRMTDQVNNANYYNSQVDKKNIEDIRDVRATYATKDQIARKVDTRHLIANRANARDLDADLVMSEYLRAGKSAVDTIRADKMISASGIVGNLDVANANASRINLVSGNDAGVLRFDGSGSYTMNKRDNALVAGMPVGSEFKIDGIKPISFDPTQGKMIASSADIGALNFDSAAAYNLQKKNNDLVMGMPQGSKLKLDGEMPISFDPTAGMMQAMHGDFNHVKVGNLDVVGGELNFDGKYHIKGNQSSLGVGLPSGSDMKIEGTNPISINSTEGSIGYNNKFKVRERNFTYKNQPVYGLSTSFDNTDILGHFDLNNTRFSTLNSDLYLTSGDKTYSYLELNATNSDDVYMYTSPNWKGIGTYGSKPFNLYSESSINANQMNISGISFDTVAPTAGTYPAIINEPGKFTIYGKGSLGSKNVNVNDTLTAPRVVGENEVRSGASFLKSDGNIGGTRLCLGNRCADNTNFQALGPTGATGPIGATGAAGATGATGPIGPSGIVANSFKAIKIFDNLLSWKDVLSAQFTVGSGQKILMITGSGLSTAASTGFRFNAILTATTGYSITKTFKYLFNVQNTHASFSHNFVLTNADLPAGTYSLKVSATVDSGFGTFITDNNDALSAVIIELP